MANVRRAAESLRIRGRREVLDDLEKCRTLAYGPVERGIAWDWLWTQANDADVTLHAHPKGVAAVRFHPGRELMMSAGRDGNVILWNVHDWKKLREIRYSNNSEVNAAEFSADGSLLAVVGDDGRLVVYRSDDGAAILDEQITPDRLFDLAWIGNKPEVAVGGDGRNLWFVDTTTGNRRTKLLEVDAESRAAIRPIRTKSSR